VGALRSNVDAGATPAIDTGPSGSRRTTVFTDGSTAELSVFASPGADRLAWDITTSDADGLMYRAAVDALTGRVLARVSLTKFASNASVYPNYPGAAGTANALMSVDLAPWLTSTTRLSGNNAHVYADLDDTSTPTEIPPSAAGPPPNWIYAFTSFPVPANGCTATALCAWKHTPSGQATATRTANLNQNGAQVFYFVNTFHDHLAAAPINFTAASGAFEGTDRLNAETLDGATMTADVPDSNHVNNANMYTPANGISPRMQMYLFSNAGNVFRDVNGGDSAAIVYHEYTHGLSNRLVVTAAGDGALDSVQAGAMGEAWSDWYAMDFLVAQGYEVDTPAAG
jgi:extracellular elastinolytic metalloproteinase